MHPSALTHCGLFLHNCDRGNEKCCTQGQANQGLPAQPIRLIRTS